MCCEGVGEGKSWREAPLETLRATAWALDIGGGGASRLEADVAKAVLTPTAAPVPISAPPIAPAPPYPARPPDPEFLKRAEKADDFIRGIVEELKEKGKGKEAAQLILEYGYKVGEPPTTEEGLDRARELYKNLRNLTFGRKEAQ